MKRIEATIAPSNLDAFKDVAFELGISEFDMVEIYHSTHAPAEGRKRVYRGREFVADVMLRLRMEFVVFDEDVEVTLDQIHEMVHPESVAVFKLDQIHRSAEGHVPYVPPPVPASTHAAAAAIGQVIGLVPRNGHKRP